jgi:putative endonuclease
MADPRHELGIAAEAAAEAWLCRVGWNVIARRSRALGRGELDLVALDDHAILVAVEVRARRSSRAGAPEATLDAARVRRLRRALSAYAVEHRIPHRGLRVDLVTARPVTGRPGTWRLDRIPGIG